MTHLRMCEQCWKSVVEPHLAGKFFHQGVDLADLQRRLYATVNYVIPHMLHNTRVEVDYRLDISHAINGNHLEIYATYGNKKIPFSLFVINSFIYRFVLVQKL